MTSAVNVETTTGNDSMDTPSRTNRLHAASEIFRRLEEDPQGAIRDTVHVLTDLALDHAFERIRGPSTEGTTLPPGPEVRALPEAVAMPVAPLVDVAALKARIAELESVTRGLQDTIATMSRSRQARQQPRQAAKTRRGKRRGTRDQRRGAALHAAIEHEDASGGDNLTAADIATLLGVSKRCLTNWQTRGQMPQPTGRRGRANTWNRPTIDAWIAERKQAEASRGELIDSVEAARLVGVTGPTMSYYGKHCGFPKPAEGHGTSKHFFRREEVMRWIDERAQAKAAAKKPPRRAPAPDLAGLMTTRAVCQLLKVSAAGLLYIRRHNESFPPPALNRGNSLYYRQVEIEAWAAARAQRAAKTTPAPVTQPVYTRSRICGTCLHWGHLLGYTDPVCRRRNGEYSSQETKRAHTCDAYCPRPPLEEQVDEDD